MFTLKISNTPSDSDTAYTNSREEIHLKLISRLNLLVSDMLDSHDITLGNLRYPDTQSVYIDVSVNCPTLDCANTVYNSVIE